MQEQSEAGQDATEETDGQPSQDCRFLESAQVYVCLRKPEIKGQRKEQQGNKGAEPSPMDSNLGLDQADAKKVKKKKGR